jgi:di/tricarboxylate transporter
LQAACLHQPRGFAGGKPGAMTLEIGLLLAFLAVAVVLFATEVVSVDVAALLLALGLYFSGLIEADAIAQGFANEVILFLGSLFVVTEGLGRTGALLGLENRLLGLARNRPGVLLVVLLLGVGVMSAFLSNTATVGATLPLVLGLSRRLEVAPSKLLLPVAFASILGGTCTLIGTSTNIVVSGLLPRYGQEPLGLFELAPVGVPILLLGLVYLLTVGRRLLPEHGEEPLELYGVRSFFGEVTVPAGSPWVGRSFAEVASGEDPELNVLGLIDEERRDLRPMRPDRITQAGDLLLVKAPQEALLRLKSRKELNLAVDETWGEREGGLVQIHEVLLAPGSRLSGRSVRAQQLGSRYGVTVIAIYRREGVRRKRLGDVVLRDGDVLLVQGDVSPLQWLFRDGDLILLEQSEVPAPGWRAWLALGLFAAMIVAGGAGWVPFFLAAVAAATLMVLSGCLRPAQAYQAVEWRLLVMVGSLLALATAMEGTGAAAYLARLVLEVGRDAGPYALLGGFYLLTMALTQPMSNQAAALVVLPLAIRTALELGLDPRPFAVTVALAASCSFITPLEPASLLVYGPGRYRFRDFFVVGLPLTLIVLAVSLLLVPRLWPLAGG